MSAGSCPQLWRPRGGPSVASFVLSLTICLVAATAVAAPAAPSASPDPGGEPVPAPPPAAIGGVTETLFGYRVADPFRGLEVEPRATPWIDAQNAAADRFLAAHRPEGVADTVRQAFEVGYATQPVLRGGKLFHLRWDGQEEQPELIVREGDSERVLVDPNALSADGKTALDWFHPSPSGERLAYGLSRDGSEDSVLHVMDVVTGQVLEDRIPSTRACSVAWLPDEESFYYTRYPKGDPYNRKVYLHCLGSSPEDDPLVFGAGRAKTDWPVVRLSEDGKELLITVERGWSAADVYRLPAGDDLVRPVVEGRDAVFEAYGMASGRIFVRTNYQAPRFRIIAIDPTRPGEESWATIVPEGEHPLVDLKLVGGHLLVEHLDRAASTLSVYSLMGALEQSVELPGLGSLEGIAGEWTADRAVLGYSSVFVPQGLWEMDLSKLQTPPTPLVTLESGLPLDHLTVTRVEYPSYDGTRVPMLIVHPKGTKPDASTPMLVWGYGGFNISLSPYFSRRAVAWLALGGTYAVPNLRGGGELGEEWHEAGKRERKFQVYEDLRHALHYLVAEGWTTPERTALLGGSNGGLLMGAAMTRFPHLFECAVGLVGLYDMVRFDRFQMAELWVDEYGNPQDAHDLGFLLGMSPYHQLVDGVRYPAFFGLTADSDTRVHWSHTAKFVARLQAATAGDAPVLFRMHRKQGHGQGSGKTDTIREYTEVFEFILSQVRRAPVEDDAAEGE